ncbi:translation initiation factor IF-2 subunit beta [candidate division MSBL1 archaeon SCGC-AAA261F17]|uniref:Translation initiation factor 2 subunit beta n=1 Tax=candidate division MSBL1 archaeon SCGC-AAA261F17 TaxID=1698274 RepID=A0A133V776_9EURY|nr:translation initiation factor IF-2 subunit beta [candidate division MSBL1 archaeon SCGC-AAA261F17]
MGEDYDELLDHALDQVPEFTAEKERFETPEADIDVSGNQTALQNLKSIADELNRNPDHLMKYLLGELGTAGNREGARGVFQGRFGKESVQDRINRYVEEFVLCPECKKPDTKLVKEGRITLLKCEACGARSSVGKV